MRLSVPRRREADRERELDVASGMADILAERFYNHARERVPANMPGESRQSFHVRRARAARDWRAAADEVRLHYPRLATHMYGHARRVLRGSFDKTLFLLIFYYDESEKRLRFWCPSRKAGSGLGLPYINQEMVDGISSEGVPGIRAWRLEIGEAKQGLLNPEGLAAEYTGDLLQLQRDGKTSYPYGDWLVGIKSAIYLPLSKKTHEFVASARRVPWKDIGAVVCVCSPHVMPLGDMRLTCSTHPSFFRDMVEDLQTTARVGFNHALSWFALLAGRNREEQQQLAAMYRIGAAHDERHNLDVPLQSLRSDLSLLGEAFPGITGSDPFKAAMERLARLSRDVEERSDFLIDPTSRGETSVQDLVKKIQERYPSEAWQVAITVEEGLHTIAAHPFMLKIGVSELMHNAFDICEKRAGRQAEIQIAIRRANDGVEIVVRDNGPGIEKRLLPTLLFDRRISSGRDGDEHAGVGLWVLRTLIEGQGGTISACNRNHGERGAEFRLWFPSERTTR